MAWRWKGSGILWAVLLAMALIGCGGTCEVRFEMNGGELVSGTLLQNVPRGGSAEAPVVRRDGYAFDGWSEDPSNVRSNMVIVARWTEAWHVVFDTPEDTVVSGERDQWVRDGDRPDPPVVSRPDWDFQGWDPAVARVFEDTTFRAVWDRSSLSPEDIHSLISRATVEIAVYDSAGRQSAIGSGFFINDQGRLVTNYHVVEGAASAKAILYDGSSRDILGANGWSQELDLAVCQADIIDNDYLRISGSGVVTGQQIYTLGSSEGLTDTFSSGNVANASRVIEGKQCIQITAPISHGNSGGPLVDAHAEVVGVNTMGYTEGQNLNFAVDIRELEKVALGVVKAFPDADPAPDPTPDPTPSSSNPFLPSDDVEIEPNDSWDLSDELPNGSYMVGEVTDDEDLDMFSFSLDAPGQVSLEVMPQFKSDTDRLRCVVFLDTEDSLIYVADLEPTDRDNGNHVMYAELSLEAELYYLRVMLKDGETSDGPIYYCALGEW